MCVSVEVGGVGGGGVLTLHKLSAQRAFRDLLQGRGCRVQGAGFRVQGSGSRVHRSVLGCGV